MADGKVRIDIELTKDKFERQLSRLDANIKKISKGIENTGIKLGGSFKKIGTGFSSLLTSASGKLNIAQTKLEGVNKTLGITPQHIERTERALHRMAGVGILALGAMGGAGLAFNSQMESYTTNFEVMLGSQEKAVKKVNQLKEMAAKTPFELGDLADATQTLLAFQVPAEKTEKVLNQLGDISLGNKEKLSSLALVFGQVSSAGRLTGQDLLQFINSGFNPLNYIAKRTGESMEELRDRMSEGGVTVEEVEQAFADATEKGGQFYQGMEKGSKTLKGQLSTLKDNLNELFGGVMKPLFDYLSNTALPKLIEMVGKANPEKIITAFKILAPIVVGVTTSLLLFKGALLAVQIATIAVSKAQAILNAVMAMNPYVLIAIAIAGVVAALVTLWHTSEGFREAVMKIWEAIKGAFIYTIDSIIDAYHRAVDGFNSAWEWIKGVWNAAPDFFRSVWEGIKRPFITVADWFGSIFSKAWARVKAVFSAGGAIFQGIKEGIASTFKGIVNSLISGINTVVSIPFNKINSALARLRGISILGKKPFGFLPSIGVPQIPYLRKGGVLGKGQVGFLEGDGAEAVVPLEKNKKWIRRVASDMVMSLNAQGTGNQGGNVTNTKNITQNFYNKTTSPYEAYRKVVWA